MNRVALCVDDEADMTALLRFQLKREGWHVITAATGREALEAVAQRRPDLILLDLMLPDVDGFSVCELLRREPETAAIPVIVLSAWSSDEARALGFEMGVLEYITKPFDSRELMKRIRRLADDDVRGGFGSRVSGFGFELQPETRNQ